MNLFNFDTEKTFHYENGFYLTSHITRIGKLLAHYELYKLIMNLPGHVVECGVFKGASLLRFATFRELFESPFSRKIIGFDIFGEFPLSENQDDNKYAKRHDETSGTGISEEELKKILQFKNIQNVEFVKGNILETVPKYIKEKPETKIALLHIDTDVYEPAKVILMNLWDKIVPGGILVLDDYSTVSGETRAVDEFFHEKMVVQKFPFAHIPVWIKK